MREIQLRDAKSGLSRLVDDVTSGNKAVITRRGRKEAVLMSWSEYQRLSERPSLGWLLAHAPLEAGDIAERQPARRLRGDDS